MISTQRKRLLKPLPKTRFVTFRDDDGTVLPVFTSTATLLEWRPEGAGYLDTLGAVWMAYFQANGKAGELYPYLPTWSRTINWGNHQVTGGVLKAAANAWGTTVVWGSAKTLGSDGDNIVWGTADGDNIVWGTSADTEVTWGDDADDVVVYSDDATEPLPNVAVEFGEVPTTTVPDGGI